MRTADLPSALITIDVDWAPDFMIDHVAELLLGASVKSTWFVTHRSAAIDRLRLRPDLFELGIHPNFQAGSSHGSTASEVIKHCMAIVPEAVSMRTHSLFQSTPLLQSTVQLSPVRVDLSLFLPGVPAVGPLVQYVTSPSLIRVPYSWEDDDEMARPEPRWDPTAVLLGPRPVIFDFHPVHVYLNSSSMRAYERLKSKNPRLAGVTPADAKPLVNERIGAGSTFKSLVRNLEAGPTMRVHDLVEHAAVAG